VPETPLTTVKLKIGRRVMKRSPMLILGSVVLSGGLLHAQDITGDWQGTLNVAGGLRMPV
jgi:hypothetical protein